MLKKIIFSTIFVTILIFISCSEDDSTTAPGSDPDPLPGFRISEVLSSEYNYDEDTLTASYLHTYSYDPYGRIIDGAYTFYDYADQWVVSYQYENNSTVLPYYWFIDIPSKGLKYNRRYYTYENGKIKQMLLEQVIDGVIEARGKIIYEYSGSLLTSKIFYEEMSGDWIKEEESNFSYNGSRLVERTDVESYGYTQRWDYSYINDKVSEIFEYNGSELNIQIVYEYENDNIFSITYIWSEHSKRIYEYQYENDYIKSYYVYSYDYPYGYENRSKRDYEYDENWNLTSFTDFNWNSYQNRYIPDYKSEMTYEEYWGNYFDIKKALDPITYNTGFEPGELGPELFPDCKGSYDENIFNGSVMLGSGVK